MNAARGVATALPRLLREPVHCLALGFGAGLAPVAPGTFGSLVGLAFALARAALGFAVAAAATARRDAWRASGSVVKAPGVSACTIIRHRLGRSGRHDDHDAGGAADLVGTAARHSGLFRLFDIWKPWPIREIDHGYVAAERALCSTT